MTYIGVDMISEKVSKNPIQSIFGFCFVLLLLLEIIATTHGLITHPARNFNGFYFLLSLLGFSVWILIDVKKKKISCSNFALKHLLAPLLFASLLLVSGRFVEVIKTENISVVEENQATAFDYEPINNWAAQEQQPPADYFLVQFFQKTIGYNHFGLRVKNLLATYIFFILAIALIFQFTHSWPASIGLLMLFICNSHVYDHLWFARPLTLGLVFTLFVHIIFYNRKINWPKSVISSTFFLLLTSCGFQPMIGLFSMVIALLLLGNNSDFRNKILFSAMISGILFLPIFSEMFYMSYHMQQFHQSTKTFLMSASEIFQISTWKIFITQAFFSSKVWLLIAVGIAIATYQKRNFEQIRFYLVNWIIFTLSFVVIFKLCIDYPLHDHYIFLSHWNSLIIGVSILSLFILKKTFHGFIFFSIITLSLYSYSKNAFVPFFQKDIKLLLNKDFSYLEVYKKINSVAQKDDYIYIISYQPPGVPSRTRFVAHKYYSVNQTDTAPNYRPNMGKPFYLDFIGHYWTNDNYLLEDILSNEMPDRAIFVHLKGDIEEDFAGYSQPVLPKNVEIITDDNLDIYIVNIQERNLAKSTLPFYESLVNSSNGNPSIVPILETALHISLHLKEKETFLDLFGKYKKFEKMDFIHHPHYIRYHDCRFLIEYFKSQAINLGWIK